MLAAVALARVGQPRLPGHGGVDLAGHEGRAGALPIAARHASAGAGARVAFSGISDTGYTTEKEMTAPTAGLLGSAQKEPVSVLQPTMGQKRFTVRT